MKASRELDALIHKEIFEHEIEMCPIHHSHSCCGRNLPHYSTQIADAWLVVEKLQFEFTETVVGWHEIQKWYCALDGHLHDLDKEHCAYADTAPLAICLAALKAVEK